jgi:hypothetical protein
MHRAMLYGMPSSACGSAQHSHRIILSLEVQSCHMPRNSLPKSKRLSWHCKIHGKQDKKRNVSPSTSGSCINAGQKGRAPAGISTTRSAHLCKSFRQCEVNKRGQTKTWFLNILLCQDVANSSKATHAVAGGGFHRYQGWSSSRDPIQVVCEAASPMPSGVTYRWCERSEVGLWYPGFQPWKEAVGALTS